MRLSAIPGPTRADHQRSSPWRNRMGPDPDTVSPNAADWRVGRRCTRNIHEPDDLYGQPAGVAFSPVATARTGSGSVSQTLSAIVATRRGTSGGLNLSAPFTTTLYPSRRGSRPQAGRDLCGLGAYCVHRLADLKLLARLPARNPLREASPDTASGGRPLHFEVALTRPTAPQGLAGGRRCAAVGGIHRLRSGVDPRAPRSVRPCPARRSPRLRSGIPVTSKPARDRRRT
jgi:hypothetical protein